MAFRTEKDALGKKKVPKNAYYGIHTQRAKENFEISEKPLPLELYYAITEIKIACALANKELRLLNSRKANAIVKAGREILKRKFDNEFIIDTFQAGAGTPTNMNVNEVIANRARQLLIGRKDNYKLIHPNDDVNKGQSSNNVVPSAVRIAAVKKLRRLLPVLQDLKKTLSKRGSSFGKILKTGRTHLQDAVPITLGQEFKAYSTSIEKNIERVKNTINNLQTLNVGKNAVGTGINTKPSFTRKILKHLKKINKISWREAKDPVYSTQNLTDFLEASSSLRLLAVDLNKMCNDLMLLNSGPNAGFSEIILPAVEPGSSIMPGKVNPSMCEMLNMVCFQVYGNNIAISSAVSSGNLELNVYIPLIAKNLIESISILTNGINALDKKCIRGIKANKDVCRNHFENNASLATLLTPYIGYDKAAEVVKESVKTGISIKEIALKKNLLGKKDLYRILKPVNTTNPNLR